MEFFKSIFLVRKQKPEKFKNFPQATMIITVDLEFKPGPIFFPSCLPSKISVTY